MKIDKNQPETQGIKTETTAKDKDNNNKFHEHHKRVYRLKAGRWASTRSAKQTPV